MIPSPKELAPTCINRQSTAAGGRISDRRYRRILSAMLSGGAARVLSSLVTLISLPMAVRYLGPERYGIWATVMSIAVWLNLLDLGIANSLTNLISRAYARDDRGEAASSFTTAFAITCATAVIAGAMFVLATRQVHWASIFNASPQLSQEIRATVVAAVILVLLGLPINLAGKVLAGYQELHRWNQIAGTGAALSLGGLGLGVWLKVSMPVLFLLSFGSIAAVGCLNLLALIKSKPWLRPRLKFVQRKTARELLSSGWSFLLIQIAAVVVFSSDNLIVSHYRGAAEVTPYNVAWRLVALGAVLQSLIFPALWPAYAEAQARGDRVWIRRTYAMTMKGALALNVTLAAGVLLFGQTLIRFWAGRAAVPPRSLLLAMAVWSVISGCMTVQSCLLAALNRTRLQAALSLVAAALNLGLSIALVTRIGSLGVILGTILSYMLVLVVPQTMIVTKALQELPEGESEPTRARFAEVSGCGW